MSAKVEEGKSKYSDEENLKVTQKQEFDNKFQYLLACIGLAVGLGNVWRFPKVVIENGGGAFLIPYFFMLFVQGIPVLILELTIGQRFRGNSMISLGRMHPAVWGLGCSMAAISFVTSLYYNSIISWAFIYFMNSFQKTLPWTNCPAHSSNCGNSSSISYHFFTEVLNAASDLEQPIQIVPHIFVATGLVYTVVVLSLINNVKSFGKILYVTCLYPYLMLTILFMIGISSEGADDGLIFLFTVRTEYLWKFSTWLAAAEQIFFSNSIGFGALIVYASYMPVRNNASKDAWIIAIANSATSLFAALGIFSIKGHMGLMEYRNCVKTQNPCPSTTKDFIEENRSGAGLVFIAMAKAVEMIGDGGWGSITLSIMFYFMIITLGIDSALGLFETYFALIRSIPYFKRFSYRKLLAGIAVFGFILSIPFTTNLAAHLIDVYDIYGSVLVAVVVGAFESICVCYIYGLEKFNRDYRIVNGSTPPLILRITWMYISPAVLLALIVGKLITDWEADRIMTYNNGTVYPVWAIVLCSFLFLFGVSWIFIGFIQYLMKIPKIDFGSKGYNDDFITKNFEPHQYYNIEKFIFCMKTRNDFPNNLH